MKNNYDVCHKEGGGSLPDKGVFFKNGKGKCDEIFESKLAKVWKGLWRFVHFYFFLFISLNFIWDLHPPKKLQKIFQIPSKKVWILVFFNKFKYLALAGRCHTFKLWFVENLIKGRLLSLKLIIKGKLFWIDHKTASQTFGCDFHQSRSIIYKTVEHVGVLDVSWRVGLDKADGQEAESEDERDDGQDEATGQPQHQGERLQSACVLVLFLWPTVSL